MQSKIIIDLIKHTGNAALCQRTVRQGKFALGDQQDPDILRELQSSVKTGSAGANDQYIIFLIHSQDLFFSP